jgi:hypothetical protein
VIRAVCILALAAAAAGCGGSSAAGTDVRPPSTPVATSARIDPNFDTGQTVLITGSGVRPLWLVSLVGKPIVFRNVSGSTQRVAFDHQAVRSGPIEPGGVFRYTPKLPLSLTYHVGSVQGRLQVSSVEGASP